METGDRKTRRQGEENRPRKMIEACGSSGFPWSSINARLKNSKRIHGYRTPEL
jgi:hypothetical protein